MSTHVRTYVKVDNNWFRSKEYIKTTGKLGFAVYMLILERVGCNSRAYFNINYIITQLGMNKNNRHMSERIKEVLLSLEALDLVTFHGNMYTCDVTELKDITVTKNTELYVSIREVKENYTIIYADELFPIILDDYEDYHARIGMLSMFCYIISCINKAKNICFPSMANIMKCSTVGSYHAIKAYLEELSELGVLIYSNQNIITKNGSGISQTPNYYARPIHSKELNEYVEGKAKRYKSTPMSTKSAEIKKLKCSLSLKMTNILKKRADGSITPEDEARYNELKEEYNQLCATTGTKPNFNEDVKPQHTVLKIKGGINKLHVDNDTEEIHIEHNCTYDYDEDEEFVY